MGDKEIVLTHAPAALAHLVLWLRLPIFVWYI